MSEEKSAGQVEWDRFRAIYGNAFPWVINPLCLMKFHEDQYDMIRQAWMHWCIGQGRDYYTGELTAAATPDESPTGIRPGNRPGLSLDKSLP